MITGRRAYPKWLVRGLVVFALGMTVLAAVASREHHSAENQRNAALSELVALRSRDFESSDPALAMQLALVAYRLSQTVASRSALIDATAGEMPTRWIGRPGRTALAMGDDGHRVAIAYRGNEQVTVYALRYAQLTPLATVPAAQPSGEVEAIALSDGGRLLATGDGAGRVMLWSLASPEHPRQLAVLSAGQGAVRGLSFSPRGGSLAAADASGRVQRWSLSDPAQPAAAAPLLAPPGRALDAVSYSPDGRTVAAVGSDGQLIVWPAHGGSTPLARDGFGGGTLTAVSYSPDGRTLATGGRSGIISLWRLGPGGRPHPDTVPPLSAGSAVNSLVFSRDGRCVAAGTVAMSAPVWSVVSGRPVARLPHPAAVTGVAFTDGDRHLLSIDAAGTAMVWQFPAPSTYTFGSAVTGLTYSTIRPRLAVRLRAGRIDEWDVVDEWRAAPLGSWYAAPPAQAPPDAWWLRAQQSATLTGTTTSGGGTTTSGGGTTTGTAAAIGGALQQTRRLTPIITSLLSANGRLLAVAGADHLVYLWKLGDAGGPKLANTLMGPSTAITRLALSPDDRTLAVATVEGHVWLWGVAKPSKASLSATLTAARGRLSALAFSPSDNTLVTGGANRRLTFWHYRPYQAVNRICALAGTPITAGEWKLWVPGASYNPPCPA